MSKDFSRFFKPGRVHRRIYTDPEIFELEMTHIFGRAWVYIGHESQIKNKSYVDLQKAAARLLGLTIGTEYAAGLFANDPVRLENLSDVTLSSRNF